MKHAIDFVVDAAGALFEGVGERMLKKHPNAENAHVRILAWTIDEGTMIYAGSYGSGKKYRIVGLVLPDGKLMSTPGRSIAVKGRKLRLTRKAVKTEPKVLMENVVEEGAEALASVIGDVLPNIVAEVRREVPRHTGVDLVGAPIVIGGEDKA